MKLCDCMFLFAVVTGADTTARNVSTSAFIGENGGRLQNSVAAFPSLFLECLQMEQKSG